MKCRLCGSEPLPNADLCDNCLQEAIANYETIKKLEDQGHTSHCACRQVWGDGECECMRNSTSYYILFIWEDIEPELFGPFDTHESRDLKAKNLREEEGDDHGIYGLNMKDNKPEIFAYSGGFFAEADQKASEKAMEIPVIDEYICPECKNPGLPSIHGACCTACSNKKRGV